MRHWLVRKRVGRTLARVGGGRGLLHTMCLAPALPLWFPALPIYSQKLLEIIIWSVRAIRYAICKYSNGHLPTHTQNLTLDLLSLEVLVPPIIGLVGLTLCNK